MFAKCSRTIWSSGSGQAALLKKVLVGGRPTLRSYKTQNYIGGKWLDGVKTMAIRDPSDDSKIAEVHIPSDQQITAAVDAASASQKTWSKVAPRVRGEILRKAYEIMIAEADRLAEIISRENGKVFSDARGEVLYAAEFFRWFAEEAVRINGEFRMAPAGDKRILVTKQPIGVSLLITRKSNQSLHFPGTSNQIVI